MDSYLFSLIHFLTGRYWLIDFAISFSVRLLPYLIILATLWVIARLPSWQARFYAAALSLVSIFIGWGVFSSIAEFFYFRLPPASVIDGVVSLINVPESSFPAASVIITASLSISLFFFRRRWGASLFILSCLIGISRIAAAVSWPTDIIVSLAVGVLIPFLFRPFLTPSHPAAS